MGEVKAISDRIERRRALALIRAAKPFADAEIRVALAEVSSDVLVGLAASREPWLVRRAALRALDGRVGVAEADAILAIAADDGLVEELRCEALTSIANAGFVHLVPALRRLRSSIAAKDPAPYRLGETLESTAALLGDADAFVPVLRLRYDAWTHRRALGERGVAALEAHFGNDALARVVGAADASRDELSRLAKEHDEPAVRRWAIDVRGADPAALEALADREPIVVEGAENVLAKAPFAIEEALRERVIDRTIDARVRARALRLLLLRGAVDEATTLYAAYPEIRIELPTVPADVRAAILTHYLPGERGTDARWLVEGALEHALHHAVPRDLPDASFLTTIGEAKAAVRPFARSIGEALPIGTVRQQGGGTYVEMRVDGCVLEISALGRFIASQDELPHSIRTALEAASFRIIDGALASTRFEGLNVYFFGSRDPLTIYDLLFYWQD